MYVSKNRTKGNGRGTHKSTENDVGSGNVSKAWKEPDYVEGFIPVRYSTCLAPNKYGQMAIFPMAWGFTHQATPRPLANCRIETADRKPLWRDSWYRRRCVISASWYYEWGYPVYDNDSRSITEHRNTKKVKFAIQTEGSDIMTVIEKFLQE